MTPCHFANTTLLGYLRANDRHGRLDSTKHPRHPRLRIHDRQHWLFHRFRHRCSHGLFPTNLARYLPASALPDLQTIYGDLTVQSSYAIGTPERDGINKAYGETQKLMVVASTCLYATIIVWVSLWREINVKGMKQNKGMTM